MIFVNLPVQDLAAARSFYEALGFRVQEQSSDDRTASVVVDEAVVVRLHTLDRFGELVPDGDGSREGDGARGTTVLPTLSAASRDEVDELVGRALAAGGREWLPARADGAAYTGSFADPDGHAWQIEWLDQLHVVN